MTNGILGGLVSITAGAHVLNTLTSLFVAFLGGLIACFFASVLEAHGIDDPVSGQCDWRLPLPPKSPAPSLTR